MRVISDELLARVHGVELSLAVWAVLLGAARLRVDIARPVSAKVVGKDETLVLEALLNVATRASELGGWNTEFGRVRVVGCEAVGHRATTREEPDLDDIAVPLQDVVSTIEAGTKGRGADLVNVAARGTVGAIESAVHAGRSGSHAFAIDLALRVGVKYVFVHLVVVDTLDDVDLWKVSLWFNRSKDIVLD
jgi:hypothetical protein